MYIYTYKVQKQQLAVRSKIRSKLIFYKLFAIRLDRAYYGCFTASCKISMYLSASIYLYI